MRIAHLNAHRLYAGISRSKYYAKYGPVLALLTGGCVDDNVLSDKSVPFATALMSEPGLLHSAVRKRLQGYLDDKKKYRESEILSWKDIRTLLFELFRSDSPVHLGRSLEDLEAGFSLIDGVGNRRDSAIPEDNRNAPSAQFYLSSLLLSDLQGSLESTERARQSDVDPRNLLQNYSEATEQARSLLTYKNGVLVGDVPTYADGYVTKSACPALFRIANQRMQLSSEAKAGSPQKQSGKGRTH